MTTYMNAPHNNHSTPASHKNISRFFTRCLTVATSLTLSLSVMAGASHTFSSNSPAFTATSIKTAFAAQDGATQKHKHTLSVDSATSIITSDSGYSATFTVTNTSQNHVPEGSVKISTAPHYDFLSSDHLDKWAQGELRLQTNHVLAQVTVPALDPGQSTQVSVKLEANNPALTTVNTWGAKPVLVNYESSNAELSDVIHTFVTRTNAGTYAQTLPAIKFVVALPISTGHIATCSQSSTLSEDAQSSIATLLDGNTKLSDENIASRTSCASTMLSSLAGLKAEHPQIQLLSDSALSRIARSSYHLNPEATIQNSGMDIAALTAAQLADSLSTAQLAQASSNKQTQSDSSSSSSRVDGDSSDSSDSSKSSESSKSSTPEDSANSSDTPSIALDGLSGWSKDALNTAHKLGYNTVLATQGFNSTTDSAVHNSIARTTIDGSPMTVLIAQHELSTLAQGKATTQASDAEVTSAGRINRFIAQTAFYETQAPYEERTVLINAADTTQNFNSEHIAYIHSLVSALKSAPWAQLTDINALMNSQSAYIDSEVDSFIESVPSINNATAQSLRSITQSLHDNSTRLNTLFSSVVDSAQLNPTDKKSRNPQDLATGKANRDHTLSATEFASWRNSLSSLTDTYAAQSLSSTNIAAYEQSAQKNSALTAISNVTNALMKSVRISVPQSLHVVSQTANLAVTVSNTLPVALKLNIATKSSEKVNSEVTISGKNNVIIDAHSEQQIILPIRAISGWNTTFSVYLTTPDGMDIGQVAKPLKSQVLLPF